MQIGRRLSAHAGFHASLYRVESATYTSLQLRYSRLFPGCTRTVDLEGAAHFDVEPGRRAFEVPIRQATVHIPGTSFSVQAWPSEAGYPPLATLMMT
jgi:hypothetical protein